MVALGKYHQISEELLRRSIWWYLLGKFSPVLHKTCCGYSLEVLQQGASNEYPKKLSQSYHQILLLNSSSESDLHKNVFLVLLEIPRRSDSNKYPQHMSCNTRKHTFWHKRPTKTDQPVQPCSLINLHCLHENDWLNLLSKMHSVKILIRLHKCTG